MRTTTIGRQKKAPNPAKVEVDSSELQLETRHLAFLTALVVLLCVSSFMLGRWVERQSLGPSLPSLTALDGEEQGSVEDMGDVTDELTFFDSLKMDTTVLLEDIPASAEDAKARRAGPAPASGLAQPSGRKVVQRSIGEGVMIQVFASRERTAASAQMERLRSKGYTALLVKENGRYKVRVGPYADRVEAERAAGVLREQEHVTTWIP